MPPLNDQLSPLERAEVASPPRPPSIFTGPVVARKALRKEPHRFAASGLDPLRHPGVLAPMSSPPQPAPQIPLLHPPPTSRASHDQSHSHRSIPPILNPRRGIA